MTNFERGKTYRRDEIHDALGGGIQDYLPHRGGEVVCACLNPDLNPEAPDVVLPGRGPGIEKWARVFADQGHFIPTFLKRGTGEWEYVGDYRVRRLTVDPAELARWSETADRDDLSMILYLEAAS